MLQYHQSSRNSSTSTSSNCNQEINDTHKLVAVVCYFTLLGWLIAMLVHGHHKSALARFHLRQSLGLIITAAILSCIPLIGWLLNILVVLGWFFSLYFAIKGQERLIPLVGHFYQNHLDFIQ